MKAQRLSLDIISTLPPSIIETILCFLPIEEAARTSVLSREWRYHWIKIPKLEFIESTFQVLTYEAELSVPNQSFHKLSQRKVMTDRCKFFYAIYQVLLVHEGPIREFTLSMIPDNSCVEIDHILRHLSRKNTVKKLKLDLSFGYKLPSYLFSLSHLTDLHLASCDIDRELTFCGLGNLTSLYVFEVKTSTKTILHLLSNSPLLKTVDLGIAGGTIDCTDNSTIVDLFKLLPVVENLSIWCSVVELFIQDMIPWIPQELPISLVHLKYLFIDCISFIQRYGLPFLALCVRSSPNLEKLKLEIFPDTCLEEYEIRYFTLKDYSDMRLEHLKELEIINLYNREIELDFVKLILATSPVLNKVSIFLNHELSMDEKLQISEILLHSRHASPMAQIMIGQLEKSLA
uniref:F-box/FBD/LRR-repeat protein At1g13570-like n=1 Tax=Erigeron canadensis TaxID=72917 RepID=UPI001CB91401|nr:F-box/FBD/LRR-repeat protein At1g13570-like [Erigeron canadensis]